MHFPLHEDLQCIHVFELMVNPHPRRQRWSSPYIGQRQKLGRKYIIPYMDGKIGWKYIYISRFDRNLIESEILMIPFIMDCRGNNLIVVYLEIYKVFLKELYGISYFIYIDNFMSYSFLGWKLFYSAKWHLNSFICIYMPRNISIYPRISII